MKTYEFNNATIHIHGEVNEERLKEATVRFFRNIRKSGAHREVKGV
jgi:hypothetical protein